MDRRRSPSPPPRRVLRGKSACLAGLLLLLGLARSARAEAPSPPQVLFFGITRVEPAGPDGKEPVRKLDRALTDEVRRQLGADGGVVLLPDPCATDSVLCQSIGDAVMREYAARSPQHPEVLLRGKVELDEQKQPLVTVVLIDVRPGAWDRGTNRVRAPAFTIDRCTRCQQSEDPLQGLAQEFTERVFGLLAAENLAHKEQGVPVRLRAARWPLLATSATAVVLSGLAWMKVELPCSSDPQRQCTNQLAIRKEWTAVQATIGITSLIGFGAIQIVLARRKPAASKEVTSAY